MRKPLLICLVAVCNITLNIQSQVTIGSGIPPTRAALLDLKVRQPAGAVPFVDDDANITAGRGDGGLLLPRVKLVNAQTLEPFIPADDPEFINNTNSLKERHAGLIVYNLVEDNDRELCPGLNQWDGKQWNCFQNKPGNASGYIVDCDNIKVSGSYKSSESYPDTPPGDKAVPLDASNYLTVKLNITKPGTYTVTATPAYAGDHGKTNGYFFTATGIFMEKGIYTVTVPGSGTPSWYTPSAGNSGEDGDLLAIAMNNKPLTLQDGTSCAKNIIVEDYSKKPLYTMDCSSTKVRGIYKMDVPLTAGNCIEVTVTVDPEAIGTYYSLRTDEVDGIYFEATGLLAEASQRITMRGHGTPNSLDEKHFTITSNSMKTSATCKATIFASIPKKRIYTLGSGTAPGGYALNAGRPARQLLTHENNFGLLENSIVKADMPEYEFIVSGINGVPSSAGIASIKNELTVNRPDIVLVTQDFYLAADGAPARPQAIEMARVFIDYLNQGGVLLLLWEGNPNHDRGGSQIFFSELFGNPSILQKRGWGGGGSLYKFNNTDDEILNGPFGDIRGKYWGEDASWAMSLTNLPSGELDVYSYGSDYSTTKTDGLTGDFDISGNPVIFKHKTLNLFYIGDGGFVSMDNNSLPARENGYYTYDNAICPFAYDTDTWHPAPRPNYGWDVTGNAGDNPGPSSFRADVYNSVLFCNVFAWALKRAQFNGINTR